VVVLPVDLRVALAPSLGEEALLLVGQLGRPVDEPAGLQFGLDVLVDVFLVGRRLLFDLGLRLLGDLEVADVGLDAGRQRVADALDICQVVLVGFPEVVDRLVAGLAECLGGVLVDAGDVFDVVSHQASPLFGLPVM
jgi:hypothetical protein